MYSYFFCLFHGFTYHYAKDISVSYKLPVTLSDHLRQSVRFFRSPGWMEKEFGNEFIQHQLFLPHKLIIFQSIKESLKHPILMASYLVLLVISAVVSRIKSTPLDLWDIATSSKQLT